MVLSRLPALAVVDSNVPSVARDAARIAAEYDAILVQRFLAGDEGAFTEITARYRTRMLAVAFGRLRNHADAEEIAQDTFVRAHRALANFRGESSLATWLHTIAGNLALNRYWYYFRRRQHVTQSLDRPLNEGIPTTLSDVIASGALDPAREAMTNEFSGLVAGCTARLPFRLREILRLRNDLNLSYSQIGAMLAIRIGTVKSRVARARAGLKALLMGAFPEFAAGASLGQWFETARPCGGSAA